MGAAMFSDAFSLPLLSEEEGRGVDWDAEVGEESESEARIAWMVSRTSDAYSLPSRDSSSALCDDSTEVACFGASEAAEVLGLACDYKKN